MSFEESWMNLEIVMLSEVRQRGTTYMWNLKNNKNQFIYKTDSQTLKKKTYSYQSGKGKEDELEVWDY